MISGWKKKWRELSLIGWIKLNEYLKRNSKLNSWTNKQVKNILNKNSSIQNHSASKNKKHAYLPELAQLRAHAHETKMAQGCWPEMKPQQARRFGWGSAVGTRSGRWYATVPSLGKNGKLVHLEGCHVLDLICIDLCIYFFAWMLLHKRLHQSLGCQIIVEEWGKIACSSEQKRFGIVIFICFFFFA